MLYRHKKIDYTSPAGMQGGPGIQKQVTWYVDTPYIDMTLAQFQEVSRDVGASLGDVWTLGGQAPAAGGNAFMFVKYSEVGELAGLTLGQLVTPDDPVTGDIMAEDPPGLVNYAAPTSIDESAIGINGDVDNWLYVNATAAALPQLRRIKANDDAVTSVFTVAQTDFMRPNSPRDADVFDTVPTDEDLLTVIRPYNVKVCTDVTTPIGVALGTVASGHYTIIQVRGLAAVLAKGDVLNSGLVVNRPAVPAAAGVISGSVASAANLYTQGSLILPQFATTAASLLIPCFVNFMAQ